MTGGEVQNDDSKMDSSEVSIFRRILGALGPAARELVLIIAGVLIALLVDRAVKSWDTDGQLRIARNALKSELSTSVANAIERGHIDQCIRNRLGEIRRLLDQASGSRVLPQIDIFRGPPNRRWPAISWNAVVESQIAASIPIGELNQIAVVYGVVEELQDLSQGEREAWTILSTIRGGRRAFGEAEEASLRSALSRAETHARLMASASEQLQEHVTRTGIQIDVDPVGVRDARLGVCELNVAGEG